MKRILTAILCAGILAVTAVGCSYNDALYKDGNSSSQTSEDSTQPTTSSVKDDKYGNDLDGGVPDRVPEILRRDHTHPYRHVPLLCSGAVL